MIDPREGDGANPNEEAKQEQDDIWGFRACAHTYSTGTQFPSGTNRERREGETTKMRRRRRRRRTYR
jgi:hypothetical protein